MKKVIPSRLLELQKTQGQYRQFFIDNNLNRENISILELTQHVEKIKNPIVRYGCLVSILGEPCIESNTKGFRDLGHQLFQQSFVILEAYLMGDMELSDIRECCQIITNIVQENFNPKDLVE
jgi:hypothetical protein